MDAVSARRSPEGTERWGGQACPLPSHVGRRFARRGPASVGGPAHVAGRGRGVFRVERSGGNADGDAVAGGPDPALGRVVFVGPEIGTGSGSFSRRTYTGLMRHLYLTLVSYKFAMQAVEACRGEKPGVDGPASAPGGGREVAKRPRPEEAGGGTGGRGGIPPRAKSPGSHIARETDASAVAGTRYPSDPNGTVPTAGLSVWV